MEFVTIEIKIIVHEKRERPWYHEESECGYADFMVTIPESLKFLDVKSVIERIEDLAKHDFVSEKENTEDVED